MVFSMRFFDSIFLALEIFHNMPATRNFVMKMQQTLSTVESAVQFHDDFANLLVDSFGYGRTKKTILKTAKQYGVVLPGEFIGDDEKSSGKLEIEKKTDDIAQVRVVLTKLDSSKLIKNKNDSFDAHLFESPKDSNFAMESKSPEKVSSDEDAPLSQAMKKSRIQTRCAAKRQLHFSDDDSVEAKSSMKKKKIKSGSESSFPSVGIMSTSASSTTLASIEGTQLLQTKASRMKTRSATKRFGHSSDSVPVEKNVNSRSVLSSPSLGSMSKSTSNTTLVSIESGAYKLN